MTTEDRRPQSGKPSLGRILVVDDEPDIAAMVERRLRLSGYDVVVARNGHEALSVARQENPDLIIMDLMMPGLDGHQVCSLLKTDRRFRDTPIIILSARTELNAIDASVECGADAYVGKPFDHKVLIAQVESLLCAKRAQENPPADAEFETRPAGGK